MMFYIDVLYSLFYIDVLSSKYAFSVHLSLMNSLINSNYVLSKNLSKLLNSSSKLLTS